MFFKKNLFVCLFFMVQSSVRLSAVTDNFGFYMNLTKEEKMHLIIAALDEGLLQIFANYQNNHDADQLTALLSAGLEKNKAIFAFLHIEMHPNVMYLTFLEDAYFLCKYGKTAQYLKTLTAEDRTNLFNLCYTCWRTCYIDHLNLNLSYVLDDLNEYFATLP